MFASNPTYVAYETLLKRLHRMIAEGKGDTDAADVLREAMEIPFSQLSKPERDRLNQLSGDLYQLQDDEVYEPVDDPAERTRERMAPVLQSARQRNDHEAVLSLLRKGPEFLTQYLIATLRSHAYGELGHLDTALLFQQYASQQQPHRAEYKEFILAYLWRLERRQEAVGQAYICIADASSTPQALMLSAYTLYASAEGVPSEDATPIYAQVVAVLQRALKSVQSSTLTPSMIANMHVLLGYAQGALGQYSEARSAYTQALDWDQFNDDAAEALASLEARAERPKRGHHVTELPFGLETRFRPEELLPDLALAA